MLGDAPKAGLHHVTQSDTICCVHDHQVGRTYKLGAAASALQSRKHPWHVCNPCAQPQQRHCTTAGSTARQPVCNPAFALPATRIALSSTLVVSKLMALTCAVCIFMCMCDKTCYITC